MRVAGAEGVSDDDPDRTSRKRVTDEIPCLKATVRVVHAAKTTLFKRLRDSRWYAHVKRL